jgi:hypothetical protein
MILSRSIKAKYALIIIPLLFLFSCKNEAEKTQQDLHGGRTPDIKTEFVRFWYSKTEDTLYFTVKMLENGKKINFGRIEKDKVRIKESGFDSSYYPRVFAINDIRGTNNIGDRSILILMDISSSISESVLEDQKNAIKTVVKLLPNNDIYLSRMDSTVSQSKLISKKSREGTYDNLEEEIKTHYRSNTPKYLYKAILAKIEDLSGLPAKYYPKIEHNPALSNKKPKMMFVLTDGRVKNDDGNYLGGVSNFISWKVALFSTIKEKINHGEIPNIPIHCFYFGDPEMMNGSASELKAICYTGREGDMKGKFHTGFSTDSLKEIMRGAIDEISADYELVLTVPPDKPYKGDKTTFSIWTESKSGQLAFGKYEYGIGNRIASAKFKWSTIGLGLFLGVLFIFLVYAVMQFLVPYIRYKIFLKKYVVRYSEDKSKPQDSVVVEERCYIDKRKFEDGDLIVKKCPHTVHLECWEENRNRCPEYGSKNCSTGIHYYNKKQLTDIRNASHYMPWVIYGLAGGILSWLFLKIIISDEMFNGLISGLVRVFYPSSHVDPKTGIDPYIISQFQTKLRAFMLSGTLLGFFLTGLFSYFIEFRKKTVKVVLKLIVRSLVSSLLGFLSFLIGAIIIIMAGKFLNCLWLDWIPWLIFATVMALAVSFKTEIKFLSAFLGGLISVAFSFLLLYVSNIDSEIISMFSYMFYAAGFGSAIAIVHFISEKYFLHVEGPAKERDIAIYKWMNVGGGFNKVSIGKSLDCLIQITWDEHGKVADKQAELHLENDRPFCRALEEGVGLINGRTLKKGESIHLQHGTSFFIGNTKFTYIEKDK